VIDVTFVQPVLDLMSFANVSEDETRTTVNDRHRGLSDMGLTRLAAVHWFSKSRVVLVETIITKKKLNKRNQQIKFKEVTTSLVISLQPELPEGTIHREMPMTEILGCIANSFGHPITASGGSNHSKFYNGPWDGNQPSLLGPVSNACNFVINGSFDPETKRADMLWAFNVDSYRKWLLSIRAATN